MVPTLIEILNKFWKLNSWLTYKNLSSLPIGAFVYEVEENLSPVDVFPADDNFRCIDMYFFAFLRTMCFLDISLQNSHLV